MSESLTLTELARFGQLTEREAEIARVAARQGYTKGWEMAPRVGQGTGNLDLATLKKNHPDVWKAAMREGWDLAVSKNAAGTRGTTGLLSMKEITKLAETLRGPDVNVAFPNQPPISIVNNPTPVTVQYEDE